MCVAPGRRSVASRSVIRMTTHGPVTDGRRLGSKRRLHPVLRVRAHESEALGALTSTRTYLSKGQHLVSRAVQRDRMTVPTKRWSSHHSQSHTLSRIHDPESDKAVPVLVVHGSADERIMARFMHVNTFTVIPAVRNARVVQCSSARCSTTSPVRHAPERRREEELAKTNQSADQLSGLPPSMRRCLSSGPPRSPEMPGQASPLLAVPQQRDIPRPRVIQSLPHLNGSASIHQIARASFSTSAMGGSFRPTVTEAGEGVGWMWFISPTTASKRFSNGFVRPSRCKQSIDYASFTIRRRRYFANYKALSHHSSV